MLKLVRKPPPPTEGPHGFSELFSTVVVENNEASFDQVLEVPQRGDRRKLIEQIGWFAEQLAMMSNYKSKHLMVWRKILLK